ncbi:MAG: hypothetical protein O3C34_20740, partial [Proteobacteria bacterium]|nr:hypothetical protein [Pseudomonadota bacterium]
GVHGNHPWFRLPAIDSQKSRRANPPSCNQTHYASNCGISDSPQIKSAEQPWRVTVATKGSARGVIALEQTRGPDIEIQDDPGYVAGDNYTLYLRQTGRNTYRTVNPQGRIKR